MIAYSSMGSRFITPLTALLFCLFVNNSLASPSYSCSDATHDVEKIICNNDFLSDMDNQIAAAYKNVMNSTQDEQEKYSIKQDQIAWIKQRNNCSFDYQGTDDTYECVKAAYRSRQNQLLEISQLEESTAHELYRKGNTAHREGNYYLALRYFHEAFDYATDNVEKVRVLGALAQLSKEEGNITLAKGYAEKILEIDETSKFAIAIIDAPTQTLRVSQNHYSENSSSDRCQNWKTKCLAMTWGADVVCGDKFKDFARQELNTEVSDMLASPACGAMITEALGEDFTGEDAAKAMVTGLLDII